MMSKEITLILYEIAIDCKHLLNKCVQFICNYAHKLNGVETGDSCSAVKG
jgi:hypothetical protein